jgi:hypothetical protein
MKRLHIIAAGAIFAALLAVTAVAPASAAPRLLSPSVHNVRFGAQPVDAGQTDSRFVTFTSTASETVSTTEASKEGGDTTDFPFTSACNFITLGPGDSCQVEVAFNPIAPGRRSTRLTLPAFTDPTDPLSITTVRLSGRGTSP